MHQGGVPSTTSSTKGDISSLLKKIIYEKGLWGDLTFPNTFINILFRHQICGLSNSINN